MELKELELVVAKYYDFCKLGLHFTRTNKPDESKESQVHYAIINGFFAALNNYLLLVYDDLKVNASVLFAKSNTNKVFLRVIIEATLLLDIFKHHPDYIEPYYNTYLSDKKRLSSIFDKDDEHKKYLRRFSWLPKHNKKKPSTLIDLLNYVDFENAEHREFYTVIIRSLDAFTHPSFYMGQSIETHLIADINTISPIFIKNGILSEITDNFTDFISEIYPDFAAELKNILNSPIVSPKISIDYQAIIGNLPKEINSISMIMNAISGSIKSAPNPTYSQRNIAYLLLDLAPRYEDLLRAYFSRNKFLFAIQLRTIIESLSMLHILLKEDEKRNYIFYIHQQIKSFEANNSTVELLKKYGIGLPNSNFEDTNNSNVETIAEYYKKEHGVDVSTSQILRLNGWALYLRGQDNDVVPNTIDLVNNMLNDLFKIDAIKEIQAVFEESNAYTHLTLYAFLDETMHISPNLILYLNHSLLTVLLGIIARPNLTLLSEKEKERISMDLSKRIIDLNARTFNKI